MPGGSTHQVRGYTLRKFLAQGGMAELFLAQPTDAARAQSIVVVKRVLPQFVQDQQFARMFEREAALASMLKHRNIVEVFGDEGANDSECFFAMEYVHGPDLNMILKELKEGTRPVPLEHAIQIAMGMCQGLHYAHEYRGQDGQQLSIVHRDVSPSNVMIADDGTVKITDFGVAKALALTSFTQAGTRKGKLSYMSPEQAVADPVDRRTDIFAIGTVLFEMTTLQRMFGGENELAIMHKLLFRERPRPSAIRHDYPPELERIVLKAVAQKPDDRFETAQAMYDALYAFAERRRLLTSPDRLARWIGSVIPPTPHPAEDPAFFSAHASATVLPLQRNTVVAGSDVQATVSDSGMAGNATMMDGAGVLSPIAGQLQAPRTQQQRVPTSPPVVAALPYVNATPPPTNPAMRRAPAEASSSSTLPAIAIVAGALALGAVILAGALWYKDAQKREASTATTAEPIDEAQAEPAAAEMPVLIPGVVDADPPKPTPEPAAAAAPEPFAIEPTPAAPDPSPIPAPTGMKRRNTAKKKRRPTVDPAPAPRTLPATPKPKPATPAPKPKPKTNSLDELFPSD